MRDEGSAKGMPLRKASSLIRRFRFDLRMKAAKELPRCLSLVPRPSSLVPESLAQNLLSTHANHGRTI
jgi:hypothetical protein